MRVPLLRNEFLSSPDTEECLCLVVGESCADRAGECDGDQTLGGIGGDELECEGRSSHHLQGLSFSLRSGHRLIGCVLVCGAESAGARAVAHGAIVIVLVIVLGLRALCFGVLRWAAGCGGDDLWDLV